MKLVGGDFTLAPCPECKGRGSVKHEDWQRRDGRWVRGGGRLPCPTCRGAKTVCSGDTRDRNP